MSDLLDSRYSWTRLALSLGIATVGNVGMWSIIVVLPAVQAEFGGGRGARKEQPSERGRLKDAGQDPAKGGHVRRDRKRGSQRPAISPAPSARL